jgi:hypothetical protein
LHPLLHLELEAKSAEIERTGQEVVVPTYDAVILAGDNMVHALLCLALASVVPAWQPAEEPFVAVGVWYAGPGAQAPATATSDVAALRRDLAIIRKAGFNSITTWIEWRAAEPTRGDYALAGLERLIAVAAEADLKAVVLVFVDPAPAWSGGHADAAGEFVEYVRKRLSLQRAVIEVARHTAAASAPPARIPVTASTAPGARLVMWSAIARGERRVAFAGASDPVGRDVLWLGETAGVITRNQALFAPLRPRSGGVADVTAESGAAVEIKLLESADALMIIGLNYAPSPRKATITFAREIPEAIWQNLETGAAVSFVMGKNGPVLEHTFAPRDALVLMIRKQLRQDVPTPEAPGSPPPTLSRNCPHGETVS